MNNKKSSSKKSNACFIVAIVLVWLFTLDASQLFFFWPELNTAIWDHAAFYCKIFISLFSIAATYPLPDGSGIKILWKEERGFAIVALFVILSSVIAIIFKENSYLVNGFEYSDIISYILLSVFVQLPALVRLVKYARDFY